jgi:general secretion pathway protein H
MKRRGFALVELVVVLVLIGLSMALVAPAFSRMARSVELKAAAQKISTILRYYRSEAVQTGKIQQILFDLDLREVRVQAVEIHIVEGEGEKKEISAPSKKFILPEGVQMKELKIPTPQNPADSPAIEFYPNGGSNGGSLLVDRLDHKGYRIKVNFLTGAVEIGGA